MKEFFEKPVAPEDPNIGIIRELENLGAKVEKRVNLEGAYVATFKFDTAVVTISFTLKDWQTGADLVIETLTTLPASEKGKGWGSRGVENLIRWAMANNLTDIKAVQVQERNAGFWLKNGFVADQGEEAEQIGLYTYQLPA